MKFYETSINLSFAKDSIKKMTSEIKNFNNPKWIIDNNNYNRKYSSKTNDEDLLTLSHDLHHVVVQDYDFPIFINKRKKICQHTMLTQNKYNNIINKLYPKGMEILSKFNNDSETFLVIAGGSAAKPFFTIEDDTCYEGDMDFFIINPNIFKKKLDQRVITYKYANKICNYIRQNKKEIEKIEYELKKGILNLNVTYNNGSNFKYQIILKVYSSISCLIHSFDIGSSCIAFDGKTTYMTDMGAYSQINAINLIVPEYNSPTFEKRLKKYFHRGYDLGLIHCKEFHSLGEKLHGEPVPESMMLPFMHLYITNYSSKFKYYGIIEDLAFSINDSTYNSHSIPSRVICDVNRIVDGENFHKYKNYLDEIKLCFYYLYYVSKGQENMKSVINIEKSDDIRKELISFDCTLGKIISKDKLIIALDYIINEGYYSTYFNEVNDYILKTYLGMTSTQVKKFREKFNKLTEDNPESEINAKPSLMPFYRYIFKKYQEKCNVELGFYDTFPDENDYEDFQKTPMSNSDWYGEKFYQKDNKCLLCYIPIQDIKNTVTLECGHKFHAKNNIHCNGIISKMIIENNNGDCPECFRE